MDLLNKILSIDFNYILIGFIVVFYSLEQLLQTQFKFSKRPKHLVNNLLFQVLFFVVNIFYATVTVFSIEWLNDHQVGFFYLIKVPVWVKLIAGVAMFDMVSYWFHGMAHKSPVLWRFHRVHHSDSTMDASSFYRGHPIESFLWFGTSNILAAGISD